MEIPTSNNASPDSPSGSVGGGVSHHPVAVESIVASAGEPADASRFVITTRDPHYRTRNNNVKISTVRKASDLTLLDPDFNGGFAIVDYDPTKPRELTFLLDNSQSHNLAANPINIDIAFANQGHAALGADGGTA